MSATAESVSWHERARRLEFRTQAFIDGRYVDAASGATFDCINPATGKLLARVAAGDSEDINRAVISARAAFRKGGWGQLAPAKRKKVLLRLAELIREAARRLHSGGHYRVTRRLCALAQVPNCSFLREPLNSAVVQPGN